MRYLFLAAISASLLMGLSKGNAADGISIEAGVHLGNGHVDIDLFKDSLSSDGQWFNDPTYGECWQPTVAAQADWRPYQQDGHWVYSDEGWFWQSDYQWGWAAFHYGRWSHSQERNWVWVPDTVWAPSWVSWRSSDNVYGWAALPPQAVFQVGVGFQGDGDYGIQADYYTFVPSASFLSVNIGSVALSASEGRNEYTRTKVINNTYVYNDNRVIANGIPVKEVAQKTKQEIKPVKVSSAKEPGKAQGSANAISVYRPTGAKDSVKSASAAKAPAAKAPAAKQAATVPAPQAQKAPERPINTSAQEEKAAEERKTEQTKKAAESATEKKAAAERKAEPAPRTAQPVPAPKAAEERKAEPAPRSAQPAPAPKAAEERKAEPAPRSAQPVPAPKAAEERKAEPAPRAAPAQKAAEPKEAEPKKAPAAEKEKEPTK